MTERDACEDVVVAMVGKQIQGNKKFMNRTKVHESYVESRGGVGRSRPLRGGVLTGGKVV